MMSTTEFNDIVVLDNGGTHIRIGHVRNGVLCKEFERLESKTVCVPNADRQLLSIIQRYVAQHALSLKAAVLGLPAILDRKNDSISHCNNIPQLEGHGLKQFLSTALGCTVLLEQDIMLQVLGEWRAGAAQDQHSVFGIYFGTGIGAAYLLNGNPENELVQDIQAGHIPIMANGLLCKCGNTDCIEAYACGHTLTKLAEQTGCPVEDLFVQRNQSRWGNVLSEELEKFVLYQAYMLATICTLFRPNVLLIGGGIPKMTGYPHEELIHKTRNHLQKPNPSLSARFAWASLETQAPLHGALELLNRKPSH